MGVIPRIAELQAEMEGWRHDLHTHPELAFAEHRTADFVAAKLQAFGIAVHRGLAGTGVVGSLRAGKGNRALGLRADMDALPIAEMNDFAHRSTQPGKMHACGHDGHTTMLLGAAKYLAESKGFDGVVHFIFQPAEENEGGGRRMVEEGLFEKFPVEAVYGLHNYPGIAAGRFAVRPGPMMASFDVFEIVVTGRGVHAAMPHRGADPVVAGAAIIGALQTISSRETDPLEPVVLSVTQFHAGDTWNVIPEQAVLRGTTRAFRPEIQDATEAAIRRIVAGVSIGFGVTASVRYERRYPPTINSPAETETAARAAAAVTGAQEVARDLAPGMGAEDFAFMLLARPGSYVWLGNGGGEGGCFLHNPRYDFNDAILTVGASYWARLVEMELPTRA